MLFSIRLEADNDALDRHRIYQLDVERDLLGDVVVVIHHGRRGRTLVAKSIPVADLASAQALVRTKLRRRASAPRRIGCSYRVVDINAVDGIDPAPFFVDPSVASKWPSSGDLQPQSSQ